MKTLRYSIPVAVLASLVALLFITRESGAAGQPGKARPRHLVESIAVKLDCLGETWTFRGEKNGILIDVAGKGRNRQDRPVDLQGIGKVNRISATKFEYSSGDSEYSFIGLAIESESRDGKQLEYRMALCRLETKQPIWSVSEALTTRPINKPYHAIGVGLPSGDSLMMTLQSLTRAIDMPEQAGKSTSQPVDDLIETDLFVNHCPISTPMIIGTQHFVSKQMVLTK